MSATHFKYMQHWTQPDTSLLHYQNVVLLNQKKTFNSYLESIRSNIQAQTHSHHPRQALPPHAPLRVENEHAC